MELKKIDKDKDYKVSLNKLVSGYIEENPKHIDIAIIGLIRRVIKYLKICIEDPDDKEVNWGSPFIELDYPVELDKEFKITDSRGFPLPLVVSGDSEALTSKKALFTTAFRDITESVILGSLTDHIGIFEDKDEKTHMIYTGAGGDLEKFESLSPNKQKRLIDRLEKKHFSESRKPLFPSIPITLEPLDAKGKKRRAKMSLMIDFQPLHIKQDTNGDIIAYYPIVVGLDNITGYKPIYWSDEDKKELWGHLDHIFKDKAPQESFDFIDELGEPEIKPVPWGGVDYIKTSMHLENQKFGSNPKLSQGSIFDKLDNKDKNKVEEYNIKIVGVDFTVSQNKALFTLQTLLNKTDQKGVSYEKAPSNSFDYRGYIPTLNFTISEYLDVYGVGKRQSKKRGYGVYHANEREEAIKALRSLSENRYLLYYGKKYFDKKTNEARYKLIRVIKQLITIPEEYDDLTKTEYDILREGKDTPETNKKLTRLAVELSPIFVDQIENHYVLKPANIYEELKIKAPRASKFTYRFIDYLFATVAKRNSKYKSNKYWIIDINYMKLARTLKMYSWINSRNWKQIRGGLNKCYETAKNLGYLTKYETIEGKTIEKMERLTLNPDKFYKAEEIKEARKKMENEAIV